MGAVGCGGNLVGEGRSAVGGGGLCEWLGGGTSIAPIERATGAASAMGHSKASALTRDTVGKVDKTEMAP